MRILWMCNCPLTDGDPGHSGTWLSAMAKGLLNHPEVSLGVVAPARVDCLTRRDAMGAQQWVVPFLPYSGRTSPPQWWAEQVQEAYRQHKPDLVHVWGTENHWGCVSARGVFDVPVALNMQGLMSSIGPVYAGGLSYREQLRCIGPREILLRQTIGRMSRMFGALAKREERIIAAHRHAICQSPWITAHVTRINPEAKLYTCDCALREEFLNAAKWIPRGTQTMLFCCAGPAPYKGLHVAVRALAMVKRTCPQVRLRVAGELLRKGIRRDGYIQWVRNLAVELGVADEIDWLGQLDATQLVAALQDTQVAVISSFVESYSVAMAEAMYLGVPVVASYVGGTSYLGADEHTCLFCQPGDAAMLAHQTLRLFREPALASSLSAASRAVAIKRHDPEVLADSQIAIYRDILNGR